MFRLRESLLDLQKGFLYLAESKNVGILYHFISPENLGLILSRKLMKPLAGSQPMSIKKKYLHYKNDTGDSIFYGISTTRNPLWKPNSGQPWNVIRLTLDGDKISNKYPIKSYNDFWKFQDFSSRKRNAADEFYAQAEEKIITDKNGLKNPIDYIIKIDVLESAKEDFDKEGLEKYLSGINVIFVQNFNSR
jgi:hypothetical protein